MYRILYFLINLFTRLHAKFLSINDHSGLALSDKQLHFLIIGFFGFCMLVVIQPIFEWLAKHKGTVLITFFYVFTVVTVVSFSIEVGQMYTGTGTMDLYDVASGLLGFLVFFAAYIILYLLYKGIRNAVKKS